ncbi:hypothetical protein BGY98DRAFT_1077813 [Russula aff. rugulosa BPL654]|nr:hypothetical protein BGY98DRAFT_1077813 [Russula aff. rugulosa BPL654]
MFSSLARAFLLLLPLSSSVYGAAIPRNDNDHNHVSQASLPSSWFHDDDHFAHALFRRQDTPSPTFPQVGSPTWAAAYPAGTPDSSQMPQEWIDALNTAVQAGKIPNIAPPTQTAAGTVPIYGPGINAAGPSVCSNSYGCRNPGDIYDAPEGVIGIGFDDGPLPPSGTLYAFLKQNEIRATHFYIGVNIINNWNEFNTAFQNEDDIAVHTWTHPYMTTLSNADVVAQLGWTLQLIYNSTGGRLARYWRPPYGDTDARVDAIAREVFGLTTIIWNNDSEDWTLETPGGTTPEAIQANFQRWLSGPTTPGLIVLEHELTDESVQAFISAYPLMKQYDWILKSTATLAGLSPYQNVDDDTSEPTFVPLTAAGNGGEGLTATGSPSSSSAPPPPSSTGSGSSKATALPDSSSTKKNGATSASNFSPVASLVSTLALVFSLCLI